MKKKAYIFLLLAFCVRFAAFSQTDSMQVNLTEVVVTGTGTPHLLQDAPVQTEVITGKMLRNYAGKSIEDILGGLTASFAFSQDDMGSQMQLNGLGNSYILILIDGKRIHGDVGGQNELSLIDPQNIEKIEIVKGASSALYGSDAIAGVVNIITKKHHEQGMLVENTTRVGSYGDVRQHNGLSLRYGKVSSYTNFQLQHSDGWQNTAVEHTLPNEDPITDSRNKTVNRYTNWQVSERISYQPSRDWELYADGSTYWNRIYRVSGRHPHYDVKTWDMEYHNGSASVGGKWQRSKTDFISMDVDWNRHAYYYYYTATTLVEDYEKSAGTPYYPYYPYLPNQKELQSDQQRTMATLKSVFTLPYENRLSAGAEYRYDWLKAPTRVKGGKASDWTAAVYVQDEFNLIPDVNITAGLRFNQNEQFGAKFTPKVSAMWKPGNIWRLRATWSQGFKTPAIRELFYRYVRQMSGTYLYLGNPDLKPQSSNYFAIGGEYGHNGLNITVTGYYNKVKDMIALVTIPNYQAPDEYIAQYDPVKTRQYQNIEDAKTVGVDVNVRYNWREFAFGMGYSYLDTDAHQYDTNHDKMRQVTIDGTAHHKGNFFATWSHRFTPDYQLGIGLYGRMSSTRYYQDDGNGKGYQIWRISTSHTLGHSTAMSYHIEAGVDNIFNYCDRTPHGLHLGTTTPGTTVYASFTIRFNQGKRLNNKYNINTKKQNDDED
ncbi:MAG: TonB-dependent receptor [Muribaculaceae bacterium]|nr:TonB-dependent receptor [Muribaculaceae bacterium]